MDKEGYRKEQGLMSIIKDISKIEGISTAHGIGIKKVLLSCGDTESSVTQIAVTKLKKGEEVECHVHKTMDEHYIILSGEGVMDIEGESYVCRDNMYILISKGSLHSLRATTDMKFITIGIAYDK